MNSWIHLFSKFTNEALLIEFFFICVLTASYTAFWISRKRKLGVANDAIPSSLVKVYLNELINEAHLIRTQLFGLLSDTGVKIPGQAGLQADQLLEVLKAAQNQVGIGKAASTNAPTAATAAGSAVSAAHATPAALINSDPELKAKMAQLEAKLAEQTKAMDGLSQEKNRVLKELEMAKTVSKKSGSIAGNAAETDDLKKKVQILEEKLAEYSVIEDDLANLKKLQQENAQLRAAMSGKAPVPAAVAPAPSSENLANDFAAELQAAPAAEETSAPEVAPQVDEVAAIATVPTTPEKFEAAVDAVEAKLEAQPAAAPPAATAPAAAPAETASTAPAAPANVVKSEEDLLSEFEKMLDS